MAFNPSKKLLLVVVVGLVVIATFAVGLLFIFRKQTQPFLTITSRTVQNITTSIPFIGEKKPSITIKNESSTYSLALNPLFQHKPLYTQYPVLLDMYDRDIEVVITDQKQPEKSFWMYGDNNDVLFDFGSYSFQENGEKLTIFLELDPFVTKLVDWNLGGYASMYENFFYSALLQHSIVNNGQNLSEKEVKDLITAQSWDIVDHSVLVLKQHLFAVKINET